MKLNFKLRSFNHKLIWNKRHFAAAFGITTLSFLIGYYYISSYIHTSDSQGTGLTPGMKGYIQEISYSQTSIVTTQSSNDVRVLCLILTTKETLSTRGAAVNATWVRRCNRNFYVLNTDQVSPTFINTPFEETRKNLVRKMRFSLTYIYEHHINEFDWLLKADDDSYIIMENLKLLLRDQDINKPGYLGFHFNKYVASGYMGEGAGYAISNSALRHLVEFGFYPEKCPVVENKEDPENSEDVEIGRCLNISGVPVISSLDKEGKERFHHYPIQTHLFGSIPEYVFEWAKHPHREGKECCSKFSISFHCMKPEMILLVDHLLYRTSVYGLHAEQDPIG